MILIRQSELIQLGYSGDFASANWATRRNLASLVLRRRGDIQTALLLELNNPVAIAKITYVNDAP
jgi:hypothetical protein